MLPSLFPSILYHHILPFLRFWKNLKVRFELRGTQDVVNFFVCGPLLTLPTQVSNIFGVGRGPKIYKIGLSRGVTIGGNATKIGKNNHLLVIVR